jgi:hypothetical protein
MLVGAGEVECDPPNVSVSVNTVPDASRSVHRAKNVIVVIKGMMLARHAAGTSGASVVKELPV